MTKYILAFSLLTLSYMPFSNAATTTQTGNVAVHIAKRNYFHPVRFLHPYMDVWHMKGPLAEKVALSTLQTRFSNINQCRDNSEASVVLLLEPNIFYNAQLRVFHTEFIARAYTTDGEPITQVRRETEQLGMLSSTPEFYIEKGYTSAMNQTIEALLTDQAFLSVLDKNTPIKAGDLCHTLDKLPSENFYY
jgi:hypothetical protein